MLSVLLSLSIAAAPARLHLVDAAACAPAPQFVAAFSLRLPGVTFAAPEEVAEGEDRIVRIEARDDGHAVTVERVDGTRELERLVPAACEALDDVAATIVERHFAEVHWAGSSAPVELAAPATVARVEDAAPAVVPSRWRFRGALVGGYGGDGALGLPYVGLELALGSDRFDFGVLGGSSVEQRNDVAVEGRVRGELRSRVDEVLGVAAVCHRLAMVRGCAGVTAGALLLSGEAKGGLHQEDFVTDVSFAAGGTVAVTVDLGEHLFVSARAVGVAPVDPPTLLVEGADQQRVVSFKVLGSAGIGWKF